MEAMELRKRLDNWLASTSRPEGTISSALVQDARNELNKWLADEHNATRLAQRSRAVEQLSGEPAESIGPLATNLVRDELQTLAARLDRIDQPAQAATDPVGVSLIDRLRTLEHAAALMSARLAVAEDRLGIQPHPSFFTHFRGPESQHDPGQFRASNCLEVPREPARLLAKVEGERWRWWFRSSQSWYAADFGEPETENGCYRTIARHFTKIDHSKSNSAALAIVARELNDGSN